MKQRKHIEEIILEGMAASLRKSANTLTPAVKDTYLAHANVLDGCKPGTFVKSTYTYNSGFGVVYGDASTPNTFNGGNVKINHWSQTINITKEDGTIITTEKFGLAHLVTMIPKEIRPKYIGTLPSSTTTSWAPSTLGIDESRPGCRFYATNPSGLWGFIVIVGADEDPNDQAAVEKYLPYEIGLTESTTANKNLKYWEFGACYQMVSDLLGFTYWVWVWKGTGKMPETKPVNPKLPSVHYRLYENKAQPGYTSIPAFTVTPDWESLRGKYDKKVHYYRPVLDAIEQGLRNAGDTANADLIKGINPETFKPFNVTFNTSTKTVTWTGAQDSTSKVYFEGITWGIYKFTSDANRMWPNQLSYIYSAESGISWEMLANSAVCKANKITGYQAESAGHTFHMHIPTKAVATRDVMLEAIPFDMTGVAYNNTVYTVPSTQVQFAWDYVPYQINYCGASTLTVYLMGDL